MRLQREAKSGLCKERAAESGIALQIELTSCTLFLGPDFVLGPGDVIVNEADWLPQGPHSPVEGRGGRELTYSVIRALTED